MSLPVRIVWLVLGFDWKSPEPFQSELESHQGILEPVASYLKIERLSQHEYFYTALIFYTYIYPSRKKLLGTEV